MNLTIRIKKWPVYSRYLRKEWNGICIIPWIIWRGLCEAKWARDVDVYYGPMGSQNEIIPASHPAGWPYMSAKKTAALESAKTSVREEPNVTPIRKKAKS